MYNLKKMLSNDSIANDVSNDLIRKTPSSRKLRVPAQGKVMERKCVVKMANGKAEFRTGFMVSLSPLIVCLWEYRKDNRDVQLHKYLRDSWAAKMPWAVFGGHWGPKKTYPPLNTSNVLEFSWFFPSPQQELRCSLVLNWISAYLLQRFWLPLLFTCHFSLHQIDFF